MESAIYRSPGDVGVEERPVPDPGPGDVLVEVAYCGVCGSDLHIMIEGWGKPGTVGGHEYSGVVAAVGDGVTSWAPGRRRGVRALPALWGVPALSRGQAVAVRTPRGARRHRHRRGFARYVLTDARSLLAPARGMSPRVAALAEPLAVALHGITRSGMVAGDSGHGLRGRVPSARSPSLRWWPMDMGPVIVVEPGERRRQLAAELGATEVLEPAELETFPPWQPETQSPRAVDVVLRVLGEEGGHGVRLPPAPAGRPPGARGRGHRGADASTPTA